MDTNRNICDRCNRSFSYLRSLRQHKYKWLRVCTPAKASCNRCYKVFANVATLKRHEKSYCKLKMKSLEDYLKQLPSPDKSLYLPAKTKTQEPITRIFNDVSSAK